MRCGLQPVLFELRLLAPVARRPLQKKDFVLDTKRTWAHAAYALTLIGTLRWGWQANPARADESPGRASGIVQIEAGWNLTYFGKSSPVPLTSLGADPQLQFWETSSTALPLQPHRAREIEAPEALLPHRAYWVFSAEARTLRFGDWEHALPPNPPKDFFAGWNLFGVAKAWRYDRHPPEVILQWDPQREGYVRLAIGEELAPNIAYWGYAAKAGLLGGAGGLRPQSSPRPPSRLVLTSAQTQVSLLWEPPGQWSDGAPIPRGMPLWYQVRRTRVFPDGREIGTDLEPLQNTRLDDVVPEAGLYRYTVQTIIYDRQGEALRSLRSEPLEKRIQEPLQVLALGAFETAQAATHQERSTLFPRVAVTGAGNGNKVILGHITRASRGSPDRLQLEVSHLSGVPNSFSKDAHLWASPERPTMTEWTIATQNGRVWVGLILRSAGDTPHFGLEIYERIQSIDGPTLRALWADPPSAHPKRDLSIAVDRLGDIHIVWSEGHKIYYAKNFVIEQDPDPQDDQQHDPRLSVFDIHRRVPATESVKYLAKYPATKNGCRCPSCWCEESYSMREEPNPKRGHQPFGDYVDWWQQSYAYAPALHVNDHSVNIVARRFRMWDDRAVPNEAWSVMAHAPVYDTKIFAGRLPTRFVLGWRSVWKKAYEPQDELLWSGLGHTFQSLYEGTWYEDDQILVAQRPIDAGAWAAPTGAGGSSGFVRGAWRDGAKTSWRISVLDTIEAEFSERPSYPKVTSAPDGTLVIVYEKGTAFDPHQENGNHLYSARSEDGGLHWTTPTAMQANDRALRGAMPAIVVAPTGELLVVYAGSGQDEGESQGAPTLELARSRDGGTSWQTERLSGGSIKALAWPAAKPSSVSSWPHYRDTYPQVPEIVLEGSLALVPFVAAGRGPQGLEEVMVTRASWDQSVRQVVVTPRAAQSTEGKATTTSLRMVNADHVAVYNDRGPLLLDVGTGRVLAHPGSDQRPPPQGAPAESSFPDTAIPLVEVSKPSGQDASLTLNLVEGQVSLASTYGALTSHPGAGPWALALGNSHGLESTSGSFWLSSNASNLPTKRDASHVGGNVQKAVRERAALEVSETLTFFENDDGPGDHYYGERFSPQNQAVSYLTEYRLSDAQRAALEDRGPHSKDTEPKTRGILQDAQYLASYKRVWAYTLGIALAQAARSSSVEAHARAQGMARYLCAHAVLDPHREDELQGWHFSWNTQGDRWRDARLVTGASAWALHGLGVFISSEAYRVLAEDKTWIRRCYQQSLRGLMRHRRRITLEDEEEVYLMTAGTTTRGLKYADTPYSAGLHREANAQFAYYSVLDAVGYDHYDEDQPPQVKVCRQGEHAYDCRDESVEDSPHWIWQPLEKDRWRLAREPTEALNVVTEHNLDVLSVLNHALQHQEALGLNVTPDLSEVGLKAWRDGLREGIFRALWDEFGWVDEFQRAIEKDATPEAAQKMSQVLDSGEKLGRFITGGGDVVPTGNNRGADGEPLYRWTDRSPHAAIDNCSWLSLSVDYAALEENNPNLQPSRYVDQLDRCLRYTIVRFVKPLGMCPKANRNHCPEGTNTYLGTHYFQNAFRDPYIAPSELQDASYHLEATMGLILGLFRFVEAYPQHPSAATLRRTAQTLWAEAQRFVADHGFVYAGKRIQDLSTQLSSGTAVVWFLDVYAYLSAQEGHTRGSLKHYGVDVPFSTLRIFVQRAYPELVNRLGPFSLLTSGTHEGRPVTHVVDQALALEAALGHSDFETARTLFGGLVRMFEPDYGKSARLTSEVLSPLTPGEAGQDQPLFEALAAPRIFAVVDASTGQPIETQGEASLGISMQTISALAAFASKTSDAFEHELAKRMVLALLGELELRAWAHDQAHLPPEHGQGPSPGTASNDSQAALSLDQGLFRALHAEAPEASVADNVLAYFTLRKAERLQPQPFARWADTLALALSPACLNQDVGAPLETIFASQEPATVASARTFSLCALFFSERGDVNKARELLDTLAFLASGAPTDFDRTPTFKDDPQGASVRQALLPAGMEALARRAVADADPAQDALALRALLGLALEANAAPPTKKLLAAVFLQKPAGLFGLDSPELITTRPPAVAQNADARSSLIARLSDRYAHNLFSLLASDFRADRFDAFIRRFVLIRVSQQALSERPEAPLSMATWQGALEIRPYVEHAEETVAELQQFCTQESVRVGRGSIELDSLFGFKGACGVVESAFGGLLDLRHNQEATSYARILSADRNEEALRLNQLTRELLRGLNSAHSESGPFRVWAPGHPTFAKLAAAWRANPLAASPTDSSVEAVRGVLRQNLQTRLEGWFADAQDLEVHVELTGVDVAEAFRNDSPSFWMPTSGALRMTLRSAAPTHGRFMIQGHTVEVPPYPLMPAAADRSQALREFIHHRAEGHLPTLAEQADLHPAWLHGQLQRGALSDAEFARLAPVSAENRSHWRKRLKPEPVLWPGSVQGAQTQALKAVLKRPGRTLYTAFRELIKGDPQLSAAALPLALPLVAFTGDFSAGLTTMVAFNEQPGAAWLPVGSILAAELVKEVQLGEYGTGVALYYEDESQIRAHLSYQSPGGVSRAFGADKIYGFDTSHLQDLIPFDTVEPHGGVLGDVWPDSPELIGDDARIEVYVLDTEQSPEAIIETFLRHHLWWQSFLEIAAHLPDSVFRDGLLQAVRGLLLGWFFDSQAVERSARVAPSTAWHPSTPAWYKDAAGYASLEERLSATTIHAPSGKNQGEGENPSSSGQLDSEGPKGEASAKGTLEQSPEAVGTYTVPSEFERLFSTDNRPGIYVGFHDDGHLADVVRQFMVYTRYFADLAGLDASKIHPLYIRDKVIPEEAFRERSQYNEDLSGKAVYILNFSHGVPKTVDLSKMPQGIRDAFVQASQSPDNPMYELGDDMERTIERSAKLGISVNAAAGNDEGLVSEEMVPEGLTKDNLTKVAALESFSSSLMSPLSSVSNYGPKTDIAVPGIHWAELTRPGDRRSLHRSAGTSYASPIQSALEAVVILEFFEHHYELPPAARKQIVLGTSLPSDNVPNVRGILNPAKALAIAREARKLMDAGVEHARQALDELDFDLIAPLKRVGTRVVDAVKVTVIEPTENGQEVFLLTKSLNDLKTMDWAQYLDIILMKDGIPIDIISGQEMAERAAEGELEVKVEGFFGWKKATIRFASLHTPPVVSLGRYDQGTATIPMITEAPLRSDETLYWMISHDPSLLRFNIRDRQAYVKQWLEHGHTIFAPLQGSRKNGVTGMAHTMPLNKFSWTRGSDKLYSNEDESAEQKIDLYFVNSPRPRPIPGLPLYFMAYTAKNDAYLDRYQLQEHLNDFPFHKLSHPTKVLGPVEVPPADIKIEASLTKSLLYFKIEGPKDRPPSDFYGYKVFIFSVKTFGKSAPQDHLELWSAESGRQERFVELVADLSSHTSQQLKSGTDFLKSIPEEDAIYISAQLDYVGPSGLANEYLFSKAQLVREGTSPKPPEGKGPSTPASPENETNPENLKPSETVRHHRQ